MGEKHQENENHEDKVTPLRVCVCESLSVMSDSLRPRGL